MPAHEAAAGTSMPALPPTQTTRRLVVTWQHPATRSIEPIGFLSYNGRDYSFAYIRHSLAVQGFRSLLGFEDMYRVYRSDDLFPLFAQRVMDPRRPDYHRYVERLDLPNGRHAYVVCQPAHHHHVVCTSCGRTADVGDLGLGAIADEVESQTGFALDSHRIELYGLCADCRARSAGWDRSVPGQRHPG